MLGEPERTVLRRLAVHAGGCTLHAAGAVCAGPGVERDDVLELLARLDEAGESDDVHRRPRRYCTELAEHTAPMLHGPDQRRRLRRLDENGANFRRVLEDAGRHGSV